MSSKSTTNKHGFLPAQELYIVLLRGINVSGKNKLPMQDLRDLLADLGFKNAKTYIQSGNIVLQSDKSKTEIAQHITSAIKQQFDYDVPILVKTVKEWQNAINNNPYPTDGNKSLYFTFLSDIPKNTDIEINGTKDDEYTIINDVVYINVLSGYGKSKLDNNTFERKLKVRATTRNLKTTLKLLELSEDLTGFKNLSGLYPKNNLR